VADDEELVLDASRRILEHLGYRALLARNGQEAVDVVQSYKGVIHLVLLDMAMPVMDGAQAFRAIVKQRPKTRVMLCSGYELSPAAQKILDEGAWAFVRKPFRIQTLAMEVRRVLDAK
jgi:CheY-like chemotaxis protein